MTASSVGPSHKASLPETHPHCELWKSYELKAVDRGEAVVDRVGQYAAIPGKNVLDVGCGTGGIAVAFARKGAHVVGIDSGNTDPLSIKKARARAQEERTDIDFVYGDAQSMPFREKAFDIIVCNDVIEHVAGPGRLAKEIAAALKSQGILYLSAPNRFSLPNIYRDSHYGLFGVVLLPRPLARIYVTKIRKVQQRYTVGHIPTYTFLVRTFRKNGIRLTLSRSNIGGLLRNPEEIEDRSYRRIGILLKRLRLAGIAGRFLSLPMFAAGFVFMGQREGQR